MCADFTIHDPDGHNPHAHIMLTMRPLDAHGKWQGKTQKEYLCRKADEERGFTAQEFLQAKEDGWEKQYKYKNAAGVSAWLTPTQAAREPGWERCSKQPKAAKFWRQNPLCARWNSPEQLLDWREAWANAVNHALEEKQQSARVTHLRNTGTAAQQLSATTEQYLEIENKIQPKDADAIRQHRATRRKASTAEIYQQIQATTAVDDTLFSKAEQRVEQITADTRNVVVPTRKLTEPTC